ncbi:MAG: MBL fold metallo-hydrolase [Ignisphaera sp.]|uniref:MBL fold metallo-hydrolase n=1 Tax=Ignisphaera aggregans TaxID=334771 RepID=A0A7C4NMN4_9CREN
MEVAIGRRGAILFPYGICIDGHENGCFYRFVTHIHADHVIDIEKSIVFSKVVMGTPITIDLLKVLGYTIPISKGLALDYGQSIDLDRHGYIRLKTFRADHIPGSAQVVLELNDLTVGYTSDFRSPGTKTEILKNLDVLVIDATYGDPSQVRENEEVVMHEFVKLLRKLLLEGPIAIYAYHGKINDVMMKLREWNIDTPFILPLNQWNIHITLKKYGYEVKDVFLEGSKEAEEIKKSKWYIEFNLTSKFGLMKRRKGVSHILVTGRYGKTVVKLGSSWIVGLSGHADFKELVYYVDEARPRLLVVDGYRSSCAYAFSSYVNEVLGIRSTVMPY